MIKQGLYWVLSKHSRLTSVLMCECSFLIFYELIFFFYYQCYIQLYKYLSIFRFIYIRIEPHRVLRLFLVWIQNTCLESVSIVYFWYKCSSLFQIHKILDIFEFLYTKNLIYQDLEGPDSKPIRKFIIFECSLISKPKNTIRERNKPNLNGYPNVYA